jgi:hypothetical protein
MPPLESGVPIMLQAYVLDLAILLGAALAMAAAFRAPMLRPIPVPARRHR